MNVPPSALPPSVSPAPRRVGRLSSLVVVAVALVAGGCASTQSIMPSLTSLAVYKIDINQGNYLSQDMVDRLKVGMTRQQVKQTLGTPLVTSAFRDNRWDYVYEYARQGRVREHRQFTVWFAEEKLARWEGDEMPHLRRLEQADDLQPRDGGLEAGALQIVGHGGPGAPRERRASRL